MLSSYNDCMTVAVSRARASAVWQAGSPSWPASNFGSNFTAGTAANNYNTTSGYYTPDGSHAYFGMQASAVDASGTSTATWTIPYGYHGEPICFGIVGQPGATGGCILTMGGTITGTTGMIGSTLNLNSRAIPSQQSITPWRFTAATNGLSAANAGQTITIRITTASGGPCIIDAVWLEAVKPSPVFIVNNPLPACHRIAYQFGDGVTTSGSGTLTSASAQFSTALDATPASSAALVELDAQGAFGTSPTVTSVTSATQVVMSPVAAASKSSVQFSINRILNGYSLGFANTDLSSATVASHAAADADMKAITTQDSLVQLKFGPMVQIVDAYNALGAGDVNLPAGVYTLYASDGVHPNQLGYSQIAKAAVNAYMALQPEATDNTGSLGMIEMNSAPVYNPAPSRIRRVSGQLYSPEYKAAGTAYTCVAGDMFFLPMEVTEETEQWVAAYFQAATNTVTGNNIRMGLYTSREGDAAYGYPQMLVNEITSGGAYSLGTTAGIKTPGNFNISMRTGLHWLGIKIDAIGSTAATLQTVIGPNPHVPNWTTSGGAQTNIAWKMTGLAAGALPAYAPTGMTLVGTAPQVGVIVNDQ